MAQSFVRLITTRGDIVLALDAERAPLTVQNFLQYVREGYYNNLIFHRVIPNFMIQGGGFDKNMMKKATRQAIVNEAKNGLSNVRGSIAMARTSNINSATSQFFINVVDNLNLDHSAGNYGYAVFGRVIKGMDVVDAIAATPTQQRGIYRDVPREDIIILKAVIEDAASLDAADKSMPQRSKP
ncbi:MAG: peptidylprolyl isomerase [Gammaproteobacteria bacterium]